MKYIFQLNKIIMSLVKKGKNLGSGFFTLTNEKEENSFAKFIEHQHSP